MRRSAAAGLVAALLVAGAVAPTPWSRAEPPPGPRAPAAPGLRPGIDPDLRAALDGTGAGRMVTAVVTLRDQAELEAIRAPGRASRLRRVVRALQDTAEAAQAPLRALLARRRREGQVARLRRFWIFDGLAVTATPRVIREVAARPEVLAVTPDRTLEAPTADSGQGPPEPNVSLINAPALWDLGFRGRGVVVASVDTGVDLGHPDLAARWRGGPNSWFDPNGEHATPADVNGHGTWTTGVMVGGDAQGTTIGVAPEATWIAVKVFNDRGLATTVGIHRGLQWLLDPDGDPATPDAPHVVNNSWSMGSIGCNLEFQLDLRSLRAARILPVFAAGNFGPAPSTSVSPANNPEALAVGATDGSDALYPESGRGPSGCGEAETVYPDLVAPGVDIRTADLSGLYTRQTGTSLAAPHVSGALALLLDAFPGLDADQQEEALRRGAVDLGPPGPDDGYGHGRLDVLASYRWLAGRPDFALAVAPPSASAAAGETVDFTVTVTPSNGFTGEVGLSLAGMSPAEGTWAFLPPTVRDGSSRLRVTLAPSVSPGPRALTVTGTGGDLVRSAPVELVVVPEAGFTLAVDPASRPVRPGEATEFTVELSPVGGFAGQVKLSVRGLPPGARATLAPSRLVPPGTSTLTVRAGRRVPPGAYPLTVRAKSRSTRRRVTVTLVVGEAGPGSG